MEAFTVLAAVNTIGQTAQYAWTVGEALRRLIRDTRNVDETIRELHLEITRLRETANLARDQLSDLDGISNTNTNAQPGTEHGNLLARGSASRTKPQLLRCFHKLNKDVHRTLDQLARMVGGENDARQSFLMRSLRQVRLNLNAPDIKSTKDRVRSHISSLQLILLTINIEISNIAPQRANQELVTKIDKLTELFDAFVAERRVDGSQEPLNVLQLPANDGEIMTCAQHVARSARSLHDRSIASGSIAASTRTAAPEVDRISNWLSELDATSSFRDVDTETTISATGTGASYIAGASISTPATSRAETLRTEEDPAVELARLWLQQGFEAFRKSKHGEAYESFCESDKALRQLPQAQRLSLCDPWSLQYHTALSSYYRYRYHLDGDPASRLLSEVASLEHGDEARQLCSLNASHLLARIYLWTREYEAARASCERAVSGRKSILGKFHLETQRSVDLLERIMIQNQEMTTAKQKVFDRVHRNVATPRLIRALSKLTRGED